MTSFERLNKSAFNESLRVTDGEQTFRFCATNRDKTPRPCSLTDLTEEQKLEIGQIITNAAMTLEFARETFTPPLAIGEKVSFARDGQTKTMRVGHIESDSVSIRLTLQDPNE